MENVDIAQTYSLSLLNSVENMLSIFQTEERVEGFSTKTKHVLKNNSRYFLGGYL